MPSLYALGQHGVLAEVNSHLNPGEDLYAFLDDVYITCQPNRVSHLFDQLQQSLWNHARIRIHLGKTKIWNRAGVQPANCAHMVDSDGIPAWRGDPNLATHLQGIKILGTPIGHANFIDASMNEISRDHTRLLDRIPQIPDLQCAWLLLLYCAASRANYYLRALLRSDSLAFANRHDEGLRACLSNLVNVGITENSWEGLVSQLPLCLGG